MNTNVNVRVFLIENEQENGEILWSWGVANESNIQILNSVRMFHKRSDAEKQVKDFLLSCGLEVDGKWENDI